MIPMRVGNQKTTINKLKKNLDKNLFWQIEEEDKFHGDKFCRSAKKHLKP